MPQHTPEIVIDLSMSLDGFIAGPNDGKKYPLGQRGGEHVFDWFFTGDKPYRGIEVFKVEGANKKAVDQMIDNAGAMIAGRRTYDITDGWNGSHPIKGLPLFILSHSVPRDIPKGDSKITFVTDGIESAVEQAKRAAGDKNVGIGGGSAAQQALKSDLVDQIIVHVSPYILGNGVRLFDHLGDNAIQLEQISTLEGPMVTHLQYRVVH